MSESTGSETKQTDDSVEVLNQVAEVYQSKRARPASNREILESFKIIELRRMNANLEKLIELLRSM